MESAKQCNKCGEVKPVAEFHKHNGTKDGKHPSCKACVSAYNKAKGKEQRDRAEQQYGARINPSMFKHLYGCTPDQYYERMTTSAVCECCGISPEESSKGKLCYDHDHNTMEFRGVLCHTCNRAFGMLGDTLESVENLLNYARRHYA